MAKSIIPHSAPWISDDDIRAVSQRLMSGMISRGEETKALELQFAEMTGWSYVKATGSGTSAITLALRAVGVEPGDEVIIPTYVCDSVKYAVRAVGAKEVLCDIGTDWVMNYDTVVRKIGPCTKAIIAVHIFGIAVDTAPLRALGIPVVEDCCQALGRSNDGTWIGSAGDVSAYSFHPTKCLAAGEGGAIATNCLDIATRISKIAAENKTFFGFSDLHAALARSQLLRYESVLQRRLEIARQYFELLPDSFTASLHRLRHSTMFFRFPLVCDRDFSEAQRMLAERGIQSRRGVDTLLHRQAGLSERAFPNATDAFHKTISIPILPQLSDDDVARVAHGILSLIQ